MTGPGLTEELTRWWVNTATGDITSSLAKITEYGGSGPAVDLIETGRRLATLGGYRGGQSIEELTELGIAFYLSSKISRWFAAINEGRRPSDDTLLDIAYYAMMARRNRSVGGWPVGPGGARSVQPLPALGPDGLHIVPPSLAESKVIELVTAAQSDRLTPVRIQPGGSVHTWARSKENDGWVYTGTRNNPDPLQPCPLGDTKMDGACALRHTWEEIRDA